MIRIVSYGLFVVLCFAQVSAEVLSAEEIKARLQRGYGEARGVFDDVRMICRCKSWHDSAWWKAELGVEMQAEVQYTACRYIQKGGRERIDGLYVGREAPKAQDYAEWLAAVEKGEGRGFKIADGKRLLGWYSTKGTPDTTTQVGRATLEDCGEKLLDSDTRVSRFVGYDWYVRPDKVLDSKGLTIREEMEDADGYRCYRVFAPVEYNRATVFVTYWLCPERSCLPVRMEMRSEDGSLVKRTETREFMRLEDGRWAAKEVVQRDYEGGHGLEIANWTWSIERLERNVTVNCAFLSMDVQNLPVGTVVQDRDAKTECTVGERGSGEEG